MYSNKKKTYQISGQRYLHNIQNRPKKCMRITFTIVIDVFMRKRIFSRMRTDMHFKQDFAEYFKFSI